MRSAVRLLAGDLLAIAVGVAAAYTIALVLSYRRAFGGGK